MAPQKQARLLANSSAGSTFGRSLPLWTFSDHFGDSQETDAFSPNRPGDNGIYHSRCTFDLTPLSLSETRKGLTVQEEQEKRTGELALELEEWQKSHHYPLSFYTEASIDLAERTELIEAMVKANFFYVFVGIESPSKESLAEAKKFQNLRRDPLESIRFIQSQGLWVTAGFIIGFDSDTEDIFEQQTDFIDRAAIPWAMAGFCRPLPRLRFMIEC